MNIWNMLDLRRQIRLEDIYVTLKMARKQKPKTNEEISLKIWRDRGQRRIIEQLEDVELEDVLKGKCLVFRGDPGAGKSTLLKHLAYTHSTADKGKRPIPIFVMLAELMDEFDGDLDEWLSHYYRRQADLLREKLESGDCTVLLDGLDEVKQEKWESIKSRARILADWDNQVVVTCRGVAYFSGAMPPQFQVYEVVGFSEEQQRQFLSKWFEGQEGKADGLFEALKSNSRVLELTQNPLLLSLTAVVCENDPGFRLPVQRIELYERAMEFLIKRRRAFGKGTKFDAGDKRAFLGEVAFQHLIEEKEILRKQDLLDRIRIWKREKEVFTEGTREELLEELSVHNGFLRDYADGYYHFLHLTFQEYFAAYDISLRSGSDAETVWAEISPHLHDSRWREVILPLVAMLDRKYEGMGQNLVEKLLRAKSPYEDLLKRDLLLAGSCLADDVTAEVATYQRILNEAIEIAMNSRYSLQKERAEDILQDISNSRYRGAATGRFLGFLEDTDSLVRGSAASALGRMGKSDDRVIDRLLPMLGDEASSVRGSAADALGRIGKSDDRVIDRLLPMLGDEASSVRWSAVYALSRIGKSDDRVIDRLLPMLGDEASSVRSSAADALGSIGEADDRVIDKLLQAPLEDEDESVRWSAVSALGSIGEADDRVIDKLLQALLEDEDESVRWGAASALGSIGEVVEDLDDRVIDKLLQALFEDEYSDVHLVALNALGWIGKADDQVIDKLLQALLEDTDSDVRWKAASALGSIGKSDDRVIDKLLQALLEDEDSSVRSSAAGALGRVGKSDDRVIDKLLQALLEDEHWIVLKSAASALGRIGKSDDRVIDKLLSLLEDVSSSVRGSPAENAASSVRGSAASALGRIGKSDDRVIDKLLSLLEDVSSSVRGSAADALASIGGSDRRILDSLRSICENYWQYERYETDPDNDERQLRIYDLAFRTLWRNAPWG
ncbi:HEAT repeat domain-containing protein [Candidatus Poribacteria bacterium]